MDYALQPHLYKNVPVYLWPWVWWQLFQIERWIKETGRMVLGGVARDGKVYVLHVADDPNERKPWSPKDLRPLKGRHQNWITALSLVHAQREALTRNPLSRVALRALARVRLSPLSQAFAYDPTRHGDQLLLALWLRVWSALMNLRVACNEPSRLAPTPRAQPPPLHTHFQTPTTTHPHPPSRSHAPGRTCCSKKKARTFQRGLFAKLISDRSKALQSAPVPRRTGRRPVHNRQLGRSALLHPC